MKKTVKGWVVVTNDFVYFVSIHRNIAVSWMNESTAHLGNPAKLLSKTIPCTISYSVPSKKKKDV